MASYHNRYALFLDEDENHRFYPFIELENKNSDYLVLYTVGKTRLDKVSQEYYGDPYHEWLILQANPEHGGLEWNIPDNTLIRVPYPLSVTIQEFRRKLNRQKRIYGY